jgi:ABC-2 type transport system permease protein
MPVSRDPRPPIGRSPPPPRRFGRVNWLGLWTLARRDLHRVLKDYRDTVLGPAVSSLLFLAVFHFAFGGGAATAGGIPLLQFLVPGLVMIACCERAFETAAASLIYDKMEGMIADVLMAPLRPVELVVGYAASATLAGCITGLAVLAALMAFVDLPVEQPAAILLYAAAGALLHALLGIAVGLWGVKWDHYAASLTFCIIPLAYLSGAFFALGDLPEMGRVVVSLNPIFYVVDGFRFGFTGRAEGSIAVGSAVLGSAIALVALLAWRLFHTGYKVKP